MLIKALQLLGLAVHLVRSLLEPKHTLAISIPIKRGLRGCVSGFVACDKHLSVKPRAKFSRLEVETASNSFHLSM